jgi:prepilin-type N-terminal cleavage/methylation domain-containing protein
MLQRLQKRKDSGFTIIEVLIVLAIAGLILLIVFLAVPALQRNARNTQRKDDVAAVLGALNEYVNNNGGTIPTTTGSWITNAKLGFYTPANVSMTTTVPGSGTGPGLDNVQVVTGAQCGATPAAFPVAGSTRSYVAWYTVESGGGNVAQCQGS